MFGFFYDITILLIGIGLSFYFFHRSSSSPNRKKLKFYGFGTVLLCILYIISSYIKNISLTQNPYFPTFITPTTKIDTPKTITTKSKESTKPADKNSLNRVENQACIFFQGFDSIKLNFHGGENTSIYRIKNVGKTPAFWLVPYTFWCTKEDYLEKLFRRGEEFIKRNKTMGGNLGGGDTTSRILHWGKLSTLDSIKFVQDKSTIYLGGLVSYQDNLKVYYITYFCIKTWYGVDEFGFYKKYNEIKKHEEIYNNNN